MDRQIGFIGAGQMARALAGGMVRSGLITPEQLAAHDLAPEALEQFAIVAPGAQAVESNRELALTSDVVVLAVKPHQLSSVMTEIRPVLSGNTLVVSIVAGVRLAALVEDLGTERVVRVMPNTPALVGQGVAGYCLAAGAGNEDAELVEQLLESVGMAIQLDEKLMDALTGLSGSGPAFVYLVIEALADGGVRMGLPRQIALRLAAHTVRGAAEMVLATGEHPAVLKDRVASPAGTTIAGIQVLEARGLRAALISAVEAAAKRSEQLASS